MRVNGELSPDCAILQLIASCRLWFQMTSTLSGLLEAINRVNNNGRARWERLKKEKEAARRVREHMWKMGKSPGWRKCTPFTVLRGARMVVQSRNPNLCPAGLFLRTSQSLHHTRTARVISSGPQMSPSQNPRDHGSEWVYRNWPQPSPCWAGG